MKLKNIIGSLTAKFAALALALTCAGNMWAAATHQVATQAELTDAIAAASAADTIQLTADVTLEATLEIAKSITLDLNGNTLTKTLATAKDTKPVVKALSGTVEIKNGAITYDLSTYTGTGSTSYANVINVGMNMSNNIYSGGECILTLNGVDVSVTFPKGKTLAMIYVESGKLNIVDSNLSADNVTGNTSAQYMIYTNVGTNTKVNPYVTIVGTTTIDTNGKPGIHAIWLQTASSTLAITGDSVTIQAEAEWKAYSWSSAMSYAYAVNNQSGATCTIDGGKFSGKVWQTKGTITVSGGYFSYPQGTSDQKNKVTLADGYEYVTNADIATKDEYPWVVKEIPPVARLECPGEEARYFTDLREALEAGKAAGSVVTLLADVDLADVNWVPVSDFAGTFDGNNKTVSNLTINDNTLNEAGLFGVTGYGSTFKDLTLDSPTVNGRIGVGTLAGKLWASSVINCHVTGDITVTGYQCVGGIAGSDSYTVITGCSVIGDDKSTSVITGNRDPDIEDGDNIGGLVGMNGPSDPAAQKADQATSNCSVGNLTLRGWRKVGGLSGQSYNRESVYDCSVGDIDIICLADTTFATAKEETLAFGGMVGIFAVLSDDTKYRHAENSYLEGTVSNVTITCANDAVNEYAKMGIISGGQRGNNEFVEPTDTQFNVTVSGTNSTSGTKVSDNTDKIYSAYKPPVAQIVRNDAVVAQYASLAAAFSAAQDGDTVQLIADCETGATYTHANPLVFNTANATLDLNGKTLTITYNMSLVFRCNNGVVMNGTIVPGVTDSNESGDWCRYGLTIDNCTGVKVSDVVSTTGIAVGGDPDGGYTPGAGPATDVVFERCTVTARSTDRYAVFAQNNSTATIKSGTYNAYAANGSVLYSGFKPNDGGAGSLTVTGGSFMGAIPGANIGAIVISGGIFSKQPVAGLLAQGYLVVANEDAATKVAYPYTVGGVVAQIVRNDAVVAQYASLAAAVSAASAGDTVTLLTDIEVTEKVSIAKSIVLDGNGKKITATTADAKASGYYVLEFVAEQEGMSLTVKDLEVESSGFQTVLLANCDYDTPVAISNVKFASDGSCVYANGYAKMLVTGSEFKHEGAYAAGKDPVYYAAVHAGYSGEINLDGCKVESTDYGIATFPSGGTVNIKDTEVTISGTPFVSDPAAIWSRVDKGYTVYSCSTTINILEGSKISGALKATNTDTTGKTSKLAVSGGIFSEDIDSLNSSATETCGVVFADGYVPTANTDAETKAAYPYTVSKYVAQNVQTSEKYFTLAAALDAAQDGNTITLLADCETGSQYTIGNPLVLRAKNATLDLNGKTITATGNFSFLISGNNAIVRNGTIKAGANTAKKTGINSYAIVVNGCDGVKLSGLTVNGGVSVGGSTGETPNAASATNVVIEDCTVTSGDYYAVCAQQNSTVTIASGSYSANPASSGSGILYASFVGTDGPKGTIYVTGGMFAGKIPRGNKAGDIVISGGIFSKTPASYCAVGYTAVENTDEATKGVYPWTVAHVNTGYIVEKDNGEGYAVIPAVDSDWIKDNVNQDGVATTAEIEAALNTKDNDTKLKKWQAYVLNQTEKPIKVTEIADTGALTTTLVEAKTGTGLDVSYSLVKIQESTTNDTPCARDKFTAELETGLYKVRVHFKPTGVASASEVTVDSVNTVGVLKTQPTGRFVVVPVPFKELGGDDAPVKVASYIRSGLANGDVLHVYNGSNYDSWTYNGNDSSWEKTTNMTKTDENTESTSESAEPSDAALSRGTAAILRRAEGNTGPLVFVGDYGAAEKQTIAAGWNLVASPSIEAFKLADKFTSGKIQIPGDVLPKNYTFNGKEWGYSGVVEVDAPNGNGKIKMPGRIKVETLPAGTGFWYFSDSQQQVEW